MFFLFLSLSLSNSRNLTSTYHSFTNRSFFYRYLTVPFNYSLQSKLNFTILPDLNRAIEKNIINKHILSNSTNDSKNSNFPQNIQYSSKIEITNPISIFTASLATELLSLLYNLPFNNERSFIKYIRHLPPATYNLTKIMIIIHIISFFMMFVGPTIVDFLFAQKTSLIFEKHQYWRMITGSFLHADIIHLLSNLCEFIFCGPYFEKYVGTNFFYFHIYLFCILISIVEGIIHYCMFYLGYTDRKDIWSVGFSGVIFALFILAGHVARKKIRRRRRGRFLFENKKDRSPSPVHPEFRHRNRFNNESSSSSSVSPSHLIVTGWGMTYEQFFSNELITWYLLIITFILVPNSSFTGHFAGIIVGEIYIYLIEPNKLIPKDENFVKKFNRWFPWIVALYFLCYNFV